jgi:gamma-glutamylcyclotransferase (GGCT)/AIG2-like uncharacterized protein YtfP
MATEALFSFGTLQLEQVQRGLFGRAVPTEPDTIVGWTIGELRILDPEVIAMSGKEIHPALLASDDPTATVEGAVLEVTADELAAADHYERVSYHRVSATTVSGRTVWVYVPNDLPA